MQQENLRQRAPEQFVARLLVMTDRRPERRLIVGRDLPLPRPITTAQRLDERRLERPVLIVDRHREGALTALVEERPHGEELVFGVALVQERKTEEAAARSAGFQETLKTGATLLDVSDVDLGLRAREIEMPEGVVPQLDSSREPAFEKLQVGGTGHLAPDDQTDRRDVMAGEGGEKTARDRRPVGRLGVQPGGADRQIVDRHEDRARHGRCGR